MRPKLSRRWLLAILLFALVVRGLDLVGQSLNMDEVYEVTHARNSVATIVFAPDSMPPLYPLTLKAWLAGWQTDAAARWLSVLLGVAAVACVYGVGRELVDDATGLAAALLLALLPLHVYYSQFVRAYAMFYFLVALALWMLVRAIKHDRPRDWCGFAVASIVGAYTHYYFVIFLAVSVLVIVYAKRGLAIGRRALVAYVAIGVCGLPLFALLPADVRFQTSLRDPNRLTAATFGYTMYSFFSGDSLGPSSRELHTISHAAAARAALPWALVMAVVVGILGWEGWRGLRGCGVVPVLLALVLLPVLLVGGLGYAGGINYHVRFVLWSTIALVVWLGAGLAAGWPKWHVRAAAALFVCISAVAIYQRHAVPRYQNEDLRGAAAYVAAHAAAGDAVFVLADYLADSVRYYLDGDWRVVELPVAGEVGRVIRDPSDVEQSAATLKARAPGNRPFWLIYSREFHGDPAALLLGDFTERYGLQLEAELAGVAIYQGRR